MNKTSTILLLFSVFIMLFSCREQNKLKNKEGFLEVNGGKIWYRVTGENGKTPVLMLHGGPGYPSYYLNPLLELGKERPIIIFDQLGCGRSDSIKDNKLMTVDAYIEQTRKLLNHLGVKEFYLYGHSWGTMLGTDYYLKYPDGIKGLIIASPCLSVKHWVADADTLINTLPDSIASVLRNEMKGRVQDSSRLARAVDIYSDSFYTRKQPVSPDIDSANKKTGTKVYEYMWGKYDFMATGTLKYYDRTSDLKKINVPVLYITGEFDAARPVTVKYYQAITPNARLAIIKNAGHMTMNDNPAEDIKAISGFLRELDKK